MIAYLRGTILEKHPNQVIVDAGGVGYDVTIPISTYSALPEAGHEVRLRIHTHVREDALSLYGFLSQDEKMLFERLITVSGIGPKVAVTVLSGLAIGELIAAIRGGEVDQLVRIPGIGKKTAERIVLELKDKVSLTADDPIVHAGEETPTHLVARDALVELGYSVLEAEQRLAGVDPELPPAERVRLALRAA